MCGGRGVFGGGDALHTSSEIRGGDLAGVERASEGEDGFFRWRSGFGVSRSAV